MQDDDDIETSESFTSFHPSGGLGNLGGLNKLGGLRTMGGLSGLNSATTSANVSPQMSTQTSGLRGLGGLGSLGGIGNVNEKVPQEIKGKQPLVLGGQGKKLGGLAGLNNTKTQQTRLTSQLESKLVLEPRTSFTQNVKTNDTALAKYLAENNEVNKELINVIKQLNIQQTNINNNTLKTLEGITEKMILVSNKKEHVHTPVNTDNPILDVKAALMDIVANIDSTIKHQPNYAYIIIPGSTSRVITSDEAVTLLENKTIQIIDGIQSLTYNFVPSEYDPDYANLSESDSFESNDNITENEILETKEELVGLKADL